MDARKIMRVRACTLCDLRLTPRGGPWPICGVSRAALSDEVVGGTGLSCPLGRWGDKEPEAERRDRLIAYALMPKRDFGDQAPGTAAHRWEAFVVEREAECAACDNTRCALKTARPCRRYALLRNPGMACPADPPRWGPAPSARESRAAEQETGEQEKTLRVVWTISACNEALLRETVSGLYASAADADIDFEVVIVDDGSTDECAKGLHCTVLRNERPEGIGFSLNLAAGYALDKLGADVVGVADAHMRVPKGAVEALARKAAGEVCVASSAAFGWEAHSAMRQWGAYLVRSRRDCLAVRWMGGKWPRRATPPQHRPREEWARVQAPLGAFYAMGREAAATLSAPTGRLWETVAGRWGFLLEPLAMKCYFLGVPVYVSRDHYTRHFYRRTNPVASAHVEKVRNIAFATAAVFSEATWRRHFRPWCVTRAGVEAEVIDALAEEARRGVRLPWTAQDEEEFLMAIPDLEDEKAAPIPIEKIWLAPPRDKMMRSGRVRRKGGKETGEQPVIIAAEGTDGRG